MLLLRCAAPTLLVLTGCVSDREHVTSEIPLAGEFNESGPKSNGDVGTAAWWVAYKDGKLDSLVKIGVDQNLTVQQAVERINSASADVTTAGAGALPALNVGASHTVSGEKGKARQQVLTKNLSESQLSLSWLLDLFGLYKRSKEGAMASLDSAYAGADVARLAYIQEIVSSYIDLRYYQQRLALSKANLKSRQETYNLTKFQVDAGAASRLDVLQAEGLVKSTRAEIPGFETKIRDSAHHIATLIGEPAGVLDDDLLRGSGQPTFWGSISPGIPADLIRNRPDIRQSERNLAAATAQIGVAQARLYPSITLSGSISPSHTNERGRHGGFPAWTFGPSLSLPILDGGRLRANIKIAKSEAAVSYLAWKQSVLTAIEQVENALSEVRRDARTVTALRAEVRTTQESLELSTASYKDGASSLLDLLDAQREVSLAQASLAVAVRQMAKDYAALNVTTGGLEHDDEVTNAAPVKSPTVRRDP
ncbi:efflux transporter outer membrane subunit [Rhizobium laguerreae]|uniref:efflux transporter outer membrane subunit n=1 Tax=Rhizobium laguerreae TaxID=1076926 RepID=UPI001C8FDC86|nr:efflux transporter outer membrane subunit [Rhizobium laguerreae]MBY3517436.1 efflux transporter outer membrane subunit [Rhizobium laguerreae]